MTLAALFGAGVLIGAGIASGVSYVIRRRAHLRKLARAGRRLVLDQTETRNEATIARLERFRRNPQDLG